MGTRTSPPPVSAVYAERTTGAASTPPVERSYEDRRTIGQLLKDLRNEAFDLVQSEVDLARAELREKIGEARRATMSIAAGGAVLFAGLILLLMGVAAGLYAMMRAAGMDAMVAGWVAPLIVGFVVALVGWGMLAAGKNKMESDNLRPTRTERSMRETARWAQRKVEGDGRA